MWSMNGLASRNTLYFQQASCCSIFSFLSSVLYFIVSPFVLFFFGHCIICLLHFTSSDYPVGIIKLFLQNEFVTESFVIIYICISYKILLYTNFKNLRISNFKIHNPMIFVVCKRVLILFILLFVRIQFSMLFQWLSKVFFSVVYNSLFSKYS